MNNMNDHGHCNHLWLDVILRKRRVIEQCGPAGVALNGRGRGGRGRWKPAPPHFAFAVVTMFVVGEDDECAGREVAVQRGWRRSCSGG